MTSAWCYGCAGTCINVAFDIWLSRDSLDQWSMMPALRPNLMRAFPVLLVPCVEWLYHTEWYGYGYDVMFVVLSNNQVCSELVCETVCCWYSVFSISHSIFYAKELRKDTPYFTIAGEIWEVFSGIKIWTKLSFLFIVLWLISNCLTLW